MAKNEGAKKARRVFDTYCLINEGKAVTKIELAGELNVTPDTIKNYVSELRSYFNVDIKNDGKRYIIKDGGDFEALQNNNKISTDDLISADDVILVISSLIQSNAFMETKMSIIRNSLLKALPPKEAKKLKDMLVFDRIGDGKDRSIEENVKKIRSAIATEKKISFTYKDYEDKIERHTMIPYSFACDLGKYYIIGKRDDTKTLKHMRIDRIITLRVLDEAGKKEEKFNVYNYLKKTWYMFGGEETKVVVRFIKKCKKLVLERNMSFGSIIREDEEYFDYEFICNGTGGIKIWLMGLGGEAEVLEPESLRNEIKKSVKEMMKIYSN
ncbi:helix-turn-helix transcriptional regulator [Clostridium chromiireducens]|nr:WYL domain-containing protein [Clostridium chromiireducens]